MMMRLRTSIRLAAGPRAAWATPPISRCTSQADRNLEFVHRAQRPKDVSGELTYDAERHPWRASVRQALRNMKATRRSMELVNEQVARELV